MVCGALIEAPAAELVVLHDDRATLARLAHPGCARSGVYAWEGTSAAVAGLTLRPDGIDVATALVWRRRAGANPSPRAIVLAEPRIHISLDDADDDPLARLFARPLGLAPVSGSLAALAPPRAPGCEIVAIADGLSVRSEALRISVPAGEPTLARWREHVDGAAALILLGRGLGITGPPEQLGATLAEALALRPCWGATVAVR